VSGFTKERQKTMQPSVKSEESMSEWKTQQQVYDELRNDILEEVAVEIEKMKCFGNDTLSSFGIFIRGMKR
jgi:hypothetical protein